MSHKLLISPLAVAEINNAYEYYETNIYQTIKFK